MIEGYKIIPFVPAGRERTLKVLVKYFIKHKDKIDHVQLWVNTTVPEDIKYMESLNKMDPEFFRLLRVPMEYEFYHPAHPNADVETEKGRKYRRGPVQWNTGRFYEYTTDPEAIYIRFDDDIVYIHDDFFENIVRFRINNPDYFVVFANIWNNAIVSYIHQQEGRIDYKSGTVESPYCMDMTGWASPDFAISIHKNLLESIEQGDTKDWYFDGSCVHDDLQWMGNGYELLDATRFSISCFAYFGKEFAKWGGKFKDKDEEIFLTEIYPNKTGKSNVICGDALVSHLTFSPYQKKAVLNTDIPQRYEKLAEKRMSESYYNLLNTHDA